MQWPRIAVAALGCALLPAAHGASLEQLRAFLTQTTSARGEFVQRVSGRPGSAQPVSSGRFVFERPGKFRWTYETPYEQVIVADGTRLVLYDKDLNQVTVRKVAAALPASPAAILFGGNDFERDFAVADSGTRDGIAWLTATPRAKDSQFERIEIGFRDGVLAAMTLADSFGQVSRLSFTRFERNPKLDPQLFRFVPPAGVDVVEER